MQFPTIGQYAATLANPFGLFRTLGEPAAELLTNIAGLASWLAANNVSHGRISSHNITVNGKLSPVLTDCSRLTRRDPQGCVSALGALAAAIYITGCEPRSHAWLKGKNALRQSGEAQRLASALAEIREYLDADAPDALKELLTLISAADSRATTAELCDKLEALAGCPLSGLPALTVFLDGAVPGKPAGSSAGERFSGYEFVGELRDMLMRADDGRSWVYLDRNGNVAIDGGFVDAQDFCEGRAIVETETGFGVIDRDGRFILAPEHEDIAFDEPTNMFIVTIDDYSALYTREGEKVTQTDYSRIMDSAEGLFVVEKNGAYGYIRKDGSVAVGMIYDDAVSFTGGTGRVALRGRTYLIDPEGNLVDEITEARKEPAPIFI